jgi:hypothetical protein
MNAVPSRNAGSYNRKQDQSRERASPIESALLFSPIMICKPGRDKVLGHFGVWICDVGWIVECIPELYAFPTLPFQLQKPMSRHIPARPPIFERQVERLMHWRTPAQQSPRTVANRERIVSDLGMVIEISATPNTSTAGDCPYDGRGK